jgi:hypothetical protein
LFYKNNLPKKIVAPKKIVFKFGMDIDNSKFQKVGLFNNLSNHQQGKQLMSFTGKTYTAGKGNF